MIITLVAFDGSLADDEQPRVDVPGSNAAGDPLPTIECQDPRPNFKLYLPARFTALTVDTAELPAIILANDLADNIWPGYLGGNTLFSRVVYTTVA